MARLVASSALTLRVQDRSPTQVKYSARFFTSAAPVNLAINRSEYWKSNPRKFCDFCKCWIADNKPSIEFHERGKRHKENVQVRLAEMGRKGQEEYEAKQQEGDFLKAMEEAALKAYKNDIEVNPDLTGAKISEVAAASNAEIVVGKKKAVEVKLPELPVKKKWYEAKSPEGYTYYWNTESGDW
nr:WW domain-binding protein 4-like [Cherax quadricarinatus]